MNLFIECVDSKENIWVDIRTGQILRDGLNEIHVVDEKTGQSRCVDAYVWQDHVNNPSMTQQQFATECDINNLMDKYRRGEDISHFVRPAGFYGDVSQVGDYQSALETVLRADAAFLELDAKVRQRFDNNPQKLVEFLSDEKNREEAVKLGLIESRSTPIPSDLERNTEALREFNEAFKSSSKSSKKVDEK